MTSFRIHLIAAFAASLLLCSCARETLLPVRDDPEVARVRDGSGDRMPYSVLIAPATIDAEFTPVRFDGASVARDMADILFESGMFLSVTSVGREADLTLELRARRIELSFRGRNKWFWPNMLLWAALLFPAWFVADETYGASLDLEAVVYSARSGRQLASHVSSVFVERDLDDFERGWFPLGIILAPSAFSSGNWEKVGDRLLPFAMRAALIDQAKWLAAGFRERVDSGEVGRLGAVGFAVCAGGSKYASADLKDSAAPAARAASLSSVLADPRIGGMTPGRVAAIHGADMTAAALSGLIESALVRLPRMEDSAVVFLSGYFRHDSGPAGARFMTYDSEPADPASSGLCLDTLADFAARSNAGRILFVFDVVASSSDPMNQVRTAMAKLASTGRSAVLIVRSGGGRDDGFVKAFTSGLAGGGDTDSNGIVTLLELRQCLSRPDGPVTEMICEKPGEFVLPFAMPWPSGRAPEGAGEHGGDSKEQPK